MLLPGVVKTCFYLFNNDIIVVAVVVVWFRWAYSAEIFFDTI